MEQAEYGAVAERSRLRRIVDFPLMTLVMAVAIYILAMALSLIVAQKVLPPIPSFTPGMMAEIVALPVLIIVYKLVIRRLGEYKRDDLRGSGAARLVSLGLGLGVLIFVISVAIAAVIGVYRIVGQGDASGLAACAPQCGAVPRIQRRDPLPRDPFPLDRGVRRKLGRAADHLDLLRRCAPLQSQRHLRLPPSALRSKRDCCSAQPIC